MGKTRIISIATEKPKKLDLTYKELQERINKALVGKGQVSEQIDYFDFLTKNRWALSTAMGDKNRVLDGTLDCKQNCLLYAHKCRKCEGVFSLPFEYDECIYCEHKEIDKEKRVIRIHDVVGRAGVLDEVHPDLYASAVKDIQEHGTPQSTEPQYDLDWKYLEDNI